MNSQKGFTLIEIIICFALSLTILGILNYLFGIGQYIYIRENQKVDIKQNIMISIDRILTDIRRQESKKLIRVVGNDKLYVNKNVYTLKNNKIYLNKNAIAYNIDTFIINEHQDETITIVIGCDEYKVDVLISLRD